MWASAAACFPACLTHFTSYIRRLLCKKALVLLFFKNLPVITYTTRGRKDALGIVFGFRSVNPNLFWGWFLSTKREVIVKAHGPHHSQLDGSQLLFSDDWLWGFDGWSIAAACSDVSSLAAGLRGAIAFSLAVRDTCTEVGRTIFTTTLLLVGFTIWVLGMAADPILHRLDIR